MTDTDKLREALTLVLLNLHTNNECACMGPQFGEPLCPCAMTHAVRERLLQMRAALAAAPQPAPDRESLMEMIAQAQDTWSPDATTPAAHIADAPLARGLRLPVEPQAAEPLIEEIVSRVSEWDDRTSPEDWPEALLITANELREELRGLARGLRLPSQDDALQQLADLGQQADRASETMAWAVVGEDGEILLNSVKKDRSKAERYIFDASERLVRVAIRVVEGGDDE